MKDYIMQRVYNMADYIIKTGCTLRFAAKIFAVSKSTAHKDMSERLYYLDKKKFEEVRKKIDLNLSQRHLRGGMATKNKYKKQQNRYYKNSSSK